MDPGAATGDRVPAPVMCAAPHNPTRQRARRSTRRTSPTRRSPSRPSRRRRRRWPRIGSLARPRLARARGRRPRRRLRLRRTRSTRAPPIAGRARSASTSSAAGGARAAAARSTRCCFRTLAERGFRIAVAGMTLPNRASVGLHEAIGFEPVGTYRRIGYKFGAWHDVAWTPAGSGKRRRAAAGAA